MKESKAYSISVKLSSKGQITIPKEVRRALNLRPGDEAILTLADHQAIMWRRPESLTDYLLGLGKELWREAGGADRYLEEERGRWEQRSS